MLLQRVGELVKRAAVVEVNEARQTPHDSGGVFPRDVRLLDLEQTLELEARERARVVTVQVVEDVAQTL